MIKKYKKLNNNLSRILILSGIVIAIFLLLLKNNSYNKNTPSGMGHRDVYVVSLSEISKTESRFKLRVATSPDFNLNPEDIIITNTNGERVRIKLSKSITPYACNDSEDDTKDHLGYETQWQTGKLDDYLISDMEVSVSKVAGEASAISVPLSHVCTRFSEDYGKSDDKANFSVPYEN